MTNQPPAPPHDHVMIDVLHRLRSMEQNLPPRVQTLEASVTEIRQEFRIMREEHTEQAAETRAVLTSFNRTLEKTSEEKKEESKMIAEALDKMGKKITFASGAFWAASFMAGVTATAIYNWQKIIPLLNLLVDGTPSP